MTDHGASQSPRSSTPNTPEAHPRPPTFPESRLSGRKRPRSGIPTGSIELSSPPERRPSVATQEGAPRIPVDMPSAPEPPNAARISAHQPLRDRDYFSSKPNPGRTTHNGESGEYVNAHGSSRSTASFFTGKLGHHFPANPADHSSFGTSRHDWNGSIFGATSGMPVGPSAVAKYLPLQTRKPFQQAYATHHHQFHPPTASHYLRTRSSHPSPHTAYNINTIADSPSPFRPEDPRATTEPSSKVPSAASSPGPFTPTHSPLRPNFPADDLTATGYPSPYLHPTQRQMPKETHLAEVDVDPISGRKLINQYEILDELGRGVHGKVKLGRNLETNEQVAIKIVERFTKRKRLGRSGNHEAKIKREIAILKKARHPNVVALLEVIDDPAKKKVYIILELIEMGEVKWRTEAPKEICLVEYRRYEREALGNFDDNAANIEDEVILEDGRRRLQRIDRARWRSMERQRLADYNDGNPMSTATQDDYQSQRKRDRDRSTRGDEDVAVRNDFDPRDGKSESNRNPVRETSSDLEGTMYGPYDSDPGWKTPSVGSGASHPADLEDSGPYIPDHFMHVPLLTLDTARRVFRDTVLGLEYLHYQGIIHRDIKPANLLQTKDEHIKISDFGVSYLGKARSEEGAGDQSESDAHDTDEALELAKTVGTPAFYAPELCQTDCEDLEPPPITNQIDVWALGVTLYCLIFGRVPFHERNSFVLMRLIAETDVYIPRLRLKAVNPQAGSYPSRNKDYRAAGTVDHEEVDDELYDLLKRLLIKDPRQRIKLIEVKRHPWVLRGLPNPIRWLEETDPGRMTQGKKIEVSKQDIDVAVVQLGVLDRVRSIAQKFKGAFSISNRAESRRRSKSSATASGDLPTSTASSSSTISQDARRQEGRRPSLRPDDVIFALRASREPEHPLSQSVTTSPEMRDRSDFLIGPDSRPDSPSLLAENQTARLSHSTQRPQPPDRAQSAVSTAGSIRTIRPADIANNSSGATTLPAMPSTPLEMPSTSSLGGILGGAKKMMRSVRSRDRGFSTYGRASPVDQLIAAGDDPHAEPSIAFSNTLAAGQVHPPASLREGSTTGSSAAPSPISSRPPSLTSPESLRPVYAITDDGGLSRQSSISSVSSRRRFRPNPDRTSVVPAYLPLLDDVGEERRFYRVVPTRDSSEDKVQRAKEQQIRRRMLEDDIAERPTSSSSRKRPSSFLMQEGVFPPCPLSPDDEAYYDQLEKSQRRTANPGAGTHTQNAKSKSTIVSSSSEDYFASHMSQSTSNPSIPSVVSAASSLPPDDRAHMNNADWMTEALPSDASSATARYAEEDDGYAGDDALETDEDDDSDDSFIEMSRRKSVKRSNSISCAEVLVHRRQTGAAESIRSVRSGSSNTMQRMKSNGGETDDEIVRGRVGRQTAEE